jgi:hypothetical protein
MCFCASIDPASLSDLVAFSSAYLKKYSAPGSDPGLCIVEESEQLDKEALIQFGREAKSTILNKDKAYNLASILNVHLSEHGGTGDGVIGALAGIGLRLKGDDGRFRGWFTLGGKGEETTAADLRKHPSVIDVIDEKGRSLRPESPIRITDEKIKTILHNHIQVIPVTRSQDSQIEYWETMSRKDVKKY